MDCLGLLEKPWKIRCEEMVRELVTGKVDQIYASTIRVDRIGGMQNCGVGFTCSSREGKVWPLRKKIAPGTSSPTNWTPNMAIM
jgi:hypothetical protein